VAFGAAALVAVAGTPAEAHSRVESITPAPGSTSSSRVAAIRMQFNEGVSLKYSTIRVTGPDGDEYQDGPLAETDALLSQRLYPTRSGEYTVAWRVTSADGHPVGGQFRFRVQLPAGGEPTGRPPRPSLVANTTGTGGHGWWLAAGGAAVGVALAAGLVLLGRNRRVHS
jgi:methionine-rich copper-binding protein CopC